MMMRLLVEQLVFHPTLLWKGFPASDQVHLDGIPRMMQPLEAPQTNQFDKRERFSETNLIGATIVGTQTESSLKFVSQREIYLGHPTTSL